MHPIRALKKAIRIRREQSQLDRAVAEHIAEIDTHVRVFGLDPTLPEILEAKEDARKLLSGPNRDFAHMIFHHLNPYQDVAYTGSHLTIHERMFGHVLQAWSLVEFHLRHYEVDAITRIRVDGSGTRVYAYNLDHEVAHYCAGVLNPHRLADPGNRVQNAAAFVDHFTSLDLLTNWEDLHKYHWVEVTKQDDGTWQVEYDSEPAYA